MRRDTVSRVGWVLFLFIGILVGGATLVLDRILNLGQPMIVRAVVGASILVVLISFLGFMARYRE
jgi:hypothetical protein